MKNPTSHPSATVTAHTPTPYAVSDGAILSDKLNDYGNFIAADCRRERTPQDEATLQFIVRACNAHAGLCAAVEESILYLDAAGLTDKADRIRNLIAALQSTKDGQPPLADLNRSLNAEIAKRDSAAPFSQ